LDSNASAAGTSTVSVKEIPFSRRRMPFNQNQAQLIIHEALKENPAPSLKEVAKRLGRDENTVRYHFPQLCKEIVGRHRNYKRARHLEKGGEIRCHLSLALNVIPPPPIKELAHRLNCSVATLKVRCPSLYRALSERHIAFKKEQLRELRSTLLKILREEHPPPSVSKVVRQLGCGSSRLYKYFPDLCHRISAQYSLHRKKSIDRIHKLDMRPT
jgi:DNA-binding CsgD family transcriptional regulator